MKELTVHYNKNLVSIKPIEDTYFDRTYLIKLMSKFARTNGCLSVVANRPNYDTVDLVTQLKTFLGSKHFTYSDFEISFNSNELSESLLDFLPPIWFAYGHTSFCFFTGNLNGFNTKRKSWNEITAHLKSYVLFRGAEEDVVWIGKSSELEFDLE